jgi:ABC-type branched-subunit amino acid transport system ATPase component
VSVRNVGLPRRHAILGLIDPDGAGRTIRFNLLTHFLTQTSGRIVRLRPVSRDMVD